MEFEILIMKVYYMKSSLDDIVLINQGINRSAKINYGENLWELKVLKEVKLNI